MANATIKLVEVGPRDGLQNEKALVATETKLNFIEKLAAAGLHFIEVTSFVSPKAIPQLSDAIEVVRGLKPHPGMHYSALVPNVKGLSRAMEAGIKEIAVFTAASNTFTQSNINMTIHESFQAFEPVLTQAKAANMWVRGYISAAFYCPYEGKIGKDPVLDVCKRLLDMGVDELSIGDTIGQATPDDVRHSLSFWLGTLPLNKVAMHFHDTNGLALENVRAALEFNVGIFDAATGGIGGCPYAPGASGNLSMNALVHLLHEQGYKTGVDEAKLAEASDFIRQLLKRTDDLVEDIGNLQYLGDV